jgi:hypothetical protein
MPEAIKELFRSQPHLAWITAVICFLSFSGLVYLLIDVLLRKVRKRTIYVEPVAPPVVQKTPSAPVVSTPPSRIPVAGKPRYRPAKKPVASRTRQKPALVIAIPPEDERPIKMVKTKGGATDETDHFPMPEQNGNSLKDAVKLVVGLETPVKKTPKRPSPKVPIVKKSEVVKDDTLPQVNGIELTETAPVLSEIKSDPPNLNGESSQSVADEKEELLLVELRAPKQETKKEPPVVNVVVNIAGMTAATAASKTDVITVESKTFLEEGAPLIQVQELVPQPPIQLPPLKKTDPELPPVDTVNDDKIKTRSDEKIGGSPVAPANKPATAEQEPPVATVTISEVTEPSPAIDHIPIMETAAVTVPVEKSAFQIAYVGYTPSDHYSPAGNDYPLVRKPEAGCVIRSPRNHRIRTRTVVEESFQWAMQTTFPAFEIDGKHCLPTASGSPYELDISLIIRGLGLNLFIDVEIDEPYDGSGTPVHCLNDDDARDAYFTQRGWVVIRFSEIQAHRQPKNCLAFIARLIQSLYPQYHIPNGLKDLPDPDRKARWTVPEASEMAATRYRNYYLGSEWKEGPPVKYEIILPLNEEELAVETEVHSP